MKKPYKKAGFTLIELLFIVIIFGVFMALITSAYQQRAINYKINKTAIQMEQILEAAIAYHEDYGSWPTTPNPPTDFLNYYLPAGSSTNPWGQPYTYTLNNTGNLQVHSGSLTRASNALQVYSLLPNATLTSTSVTLSAPTLPSDINIKSIGTFPTTGPDGNNATGNIPTPFICPAGSNLSIVAIPAVIQPGSYPLHGVIAACPAGAAPIGNLAAIIGTCTPGVSCPYTIYFYAEIPDSEAAFACTSSTNYSGGAANFTYIAYCS